MSKFPERESSQATKAPPTPSGAMTGRYWLPVAVQTGTVDPEPQGHDAAAGPGDTASKSIATSADGSA